jgi:hypothetical protein
MSTKAAGKAAFLRFAAEHDNGIRLIDQMHDDCRSAVILMRIKKFGGLPMDFSLNLSSGLFANDQKFKTFEQGHVYVLSIIGGGPPV